MQYAARQRYLEMNGVVSFKDNIRIVCNLRGAGRVFPRKVGSGPAPTTCIFVGRGAHAGASLDKCRSDSVVSYRVVSYSIITA